MDKYLKKKLDEKLLSIIKEYKPIDNRLLDAGKLIPIYKLKLEEYTKEVKGEIDRVFVDEMINELKSNITPAVKESTGGTDEILTDIACVEMASVIYQHEVGEPDGKNDINTLNEYYRRGALYFIKGSEDDKTKPIVILNNKMGKHIYRPQSKNKASQSSGCLILIIPFVGSLIYAMNSFIS